MPSEKEIEEARLYIDGKLQHCSNELEELDKQARIILDAYLSMKSERDKYKAELESYQRTYD